MEDSKYFLVVSSLSEEFQCNEWTAQLARMYTRWVQIIGGEVRLVFDVPGDDIGYCEIGYSITIPDSSGIDSVEYWEAGIHRRLKNPELIFDDLSDQRQSVDAMVSIFRDTGYQLEDENVPAGYREESFGGRRTGYILNCAHCDYSHAQFAHKVTHIPTGVCGIGNGHTSVGARYDAWNMCVSALSNLHGNLSGRQFGEDTTKPFRVYSFDFPVGVVDERNRTKTDNVNEVMDGDLKLVSGMYNKD